MFFSFCASTSFSYELSPVHVHGAPVNVLALLGDKRGFLHYPAFRRHFYSEVWHYERAAAARARVGSNPQFHGPSCLDANHAWLVARCGGGYFDHLRVPAFRRLLAGFHAPARGWGRGNQEPHPENSESNQTQE